MSELTFHFLFGKAFATEIRISTATSSQSNNTDQLPNIYSLSNQNRNAALIYEWINFSIPIHFIIIMSICAIATVGKKPFWDYRNLFVQNFQWNRIFFLQSDISIVVSVFVFIFFSLTNTEPGRINISLFFPKTRRARIPAFPTLMMSWTYEIRYKIFPLICRTHPSWALIRTSL